MHVNTMQVSSSKMSQTLITQPNCNGKRTHTQEGFETHQLKYYNSLWQARLHVLTDYDCLKCLVLQSCILLVPLICLVCCLVCLYYSKYNSKISWGRFWKQKRSKSPQSIQNPCSTAHSWNAADLDTLMAFLACLAADAVMQAPDHASLCSLTLCLPRTLYRFRVFSDFITEHPSSRFEDLWNNIFQYYLLPSLLQECRNDDYNRGTEYEFYHRDSKQADEQASKR